MKIRQYPKEKHKVLSYFDKKSEKKNPAAITW